MHMVVCRAAALAAVFSVVSLLSGAAHAQIRTARSLLGWSQDDLPSVLRTLIHCRLGAATERRGGQLRCGCHLFVRIELCISGQRFNS